MEIWTLALLFAASLFAGGLNAVAGGATFLTFPALMLAGLPAMAANATNFVALTPANVAALPAFREELTALGRAVLMPVLVGIIGGAIGAALLLTLGGGVFERAVPWLMLVATLLFAIAPVLNRALAGGNLMTSSPMLAGFLMLIFSIYGGYFGAGLGQIMLAALVIAGASDLNAANALKNASIAGITLISFGLYAASGIVHWPFAFVMMVGAGLGGYFGGRMSRKVPQKALRGMVIAFGAFLTFYYFITADG